MCCNTFKIKPVNPTASHRIFCNCGFCEDCRKAERNQWTFRLMAELSARQKANWNVGFVTMTYNDANLPYYAINEDINDNWERSVDSKFCCFSRSDIRNFILRLRKYIWKHHGISGLTYMVCSEYGDSTSRSHYHALFAWPKGSLNHEAMHKLICELWCDKGFIFPKDFRGGVDKNGYHHKPFAVDCTADAARYCAKYVCKDVSFWSDAAAAGIDVRDKYFRKECAPFHIQNRGLGHDFILDLTDSEKLSLLNDGFSFVGEDFLRSCPIYLRNKIIYDTRYVFDIVTKNRLVRRDANEFFERHKAEIYNGKLKIYTKFFEQIKDPKFSVHRLGEYLNRVYAERTDIDDVISSVVHNVDFIRDFHPSWLARYYLSYYKVPLQYRLADPVESWFNHFTFNYKKGGLHDTDLKQSNLDDAVTCALLAMQFVVNPVAADKVLVDYVSDFHKSKEY